MSQDLPECKIEIAIALKPQKGDAEMLGFRKGEKILIDRSVQGADHRGIMVFGRIGQREGFFPMDSTLVRIEEYVI